jgi:glutaminase
VRGALDQIAEPDQGGPIMRYLRELHRKLKDETGGAVASYIPELGTADPADFGIVVATVDGAVYAVGDTDKPFTIQSISKAFVYGHVLAEHGRTHVLTKVGVEPSGDAFNAIAFDDTANRPFNPMVNSGAIATAALVKGDTVGDRIHAVRELFDRLAGRQLTINDAVFQSEKKTGHRNRAIAWMMLNAGMITGDPDKALDVYFSQCSIEVTCRDLALMAATLASGGIQPLTGERVLPTASVRDVISVMNSCGMYNYAGQWSYEVGLPAKSGVGGGIIAIAPGQLGIAVYSPPLDHLGNSVRGIAAFKAISHDFSLHVFGAHAHGGAIVRREIGGDIVRSKRLRSPAERRILDADGARIRLIELQGALYFGTAERLIRRLESLPGAATTIVLDFRRVHLLDEAAAELLLRAAERSKDGPQLLFAGLAGHPALASFADRLAAKHGDETFPDSDSALQWCEDRLIGQAATGFGTHFGLAGLAIFAGLSTEEIRLLERVVKAQVFEAGEVIIHEGDPAQLFYVLASGSVGVRLKSREHAGGAGKRIATFGPGLSFGEMALFDGGARSADIVAEEHAVCYGFAVQDLYAIGKEHPNLLVTVLTNMTREMSERLRRANEEIRALDL